MVVDQSLTCIIKDNNTGEMVVFDIEKPQGYTDSYNANFQQQDVRGRSSPFQSYVNSGPRSIQFSVILSLDYRRNLAEQTDRVREMMKPFNRGSGLMIKPPSLYVKIGNAVEMNAVPAGFSAEWSEGYKEGVYRICTWSFSFTEVEEVGSYNTDVLGISYIRAEVPSGLNYITSNIPSVTTYATGDTITVSEETKFYNTSNDANNRRDEITTEVSVGDYTITNTKGNAVQIITEGGDQVWMTVGS